MGRLVIPLIITDEERDELSSWVRRRQMPTSKQRARMILLSTEGLPGRVIAERVGVTAETVSKWRKRFEQFRVAGLADAPRSGRPRSIDDDKVADVINKTLQAKPKDATHWSTTLMAKETGLNAMAISRIWRAFELKPRRLETAKPSTAPHFVAKVHDIDGLHMNPLNRAPVLGVDEKSQKQALTPLKPARDKVPMLVESSQLELFAAQAYREDLYLALKLTPHAAAHRDYASPGHISGTLKEHFGGISNTQFADSPHLPSISQGVGRIRQCIECKTTQSSKLINPEAALQGAARQLKHAYEFIINHFREIAAGYDGPSDQQPVITNEYIRTFLMTSAVCPPHWITKTPADIDDTDLNIEICQAHFLDDFLQPTLDLHPEEVSLLQSRRDGMKHALTTAREKSISSFPEPSSTSTEHFLLASDEPLACLFVKTWEAIWHLSKFTQKRKDRNRNLFAKAKTYKQALESRLKDDRGFQVVTPTFGIQSDKLSDTERQKLLAKTWEEFSKFIDSSNRKLAGRKIKSTLLDDHLIWWMRKQHTILLPTKDQRWHPHTYLTTMLVFRADTFVKHLDFSAQPDTNAMKSWALSATALRLELERAWKNCLDHVMMKIGKLDVTANGYIEFHANLLRIPLSGGGETTPAMIFTENTKNRQNLINKLHRFLEYQIYRDRAMFIALLPRPGEHKKPHSLSRMTKKPRIPNQTGPWKIPVIVEAPWRTTELDITLK